MIKATERDILTLAEAAAFLKLSKRSIYKLAKAGDIPFKRIANKYRFERELLVRWVRGEK